jgi:glycerol uptake facilitator-like aquaporin
MNARNVAAEALGSALLLAIVIGSGIMGERLAQGNAAIALLANAIATGCGLVVLISLFGPVSGAHFNPLVSIAAWCEGELSAGALLAFIAAQCIGCIAGAWLAHFMFDLPILQTSAKVRAGAGQWAGEFVATFGLLFLIRFGVAQRFSNLAMLVALYITAAYWFTSSTSFANPAVTLARSMSDTFAGIHPASVFGFVAAQIAGALAGWGVARWFARALPQQIK